VSPKLCIAKKCTGTQFYQLCLDESRNRRHAHTLFDKNLPSPQRRGRGGGGKQSTFFSKAAMRLHLGVLLEYRRSVPCSLPPPPFPPPLSTAFGWRGRPRHSANAAHQELRRRYVPAVLQTTRRGASTLTTAQATLVRRSGSTASPNTAHERPRRGHVGLEQGRSVDRVVDTSHVKQKLISISTHPPLVDCHTGRGPTPRHSASADSHPLGRGRASSSPLSAIVDPPLTSSAR